MVGRAKDFCRLDSLFQILQNYLNFYIYSLRQIGLRFIQKYLPEKCVPFIILFYNSEIHISPGYRKW